MNLGNPIALYKQMSGNAEYHSLSGADFCVLPVRSLRLGCKSWLFSPSISHAGRVAPINRKPDAQIVSCKRVGQQKPRTPIRC